MLSTSHWSTATSKLSQLSLGGVIGERVKEWCALWNPMSSHFIDASTNPILKHSLERLHFQLQHYWGYVTLANNLTQLLPLTWNISGSSCEITVWWSPIERWDKVLRMSETQSSMLLPQNLSASSKTVKKKSHNREQLEFMSPTFWCWIAYIFYL